jgi:hypothetical protein
MKKITLSISVFLGTFLTLAQVIPPPPQPEAGDIGGMPEAPIDTYLYLLFVMASIIILFYKNKLRLSKKY